MNEHLDPGYAAAARDGITRSPRSAALWLVVGALIVGVVTATAFVHAAERIPGTEEERGQLLASVRDAQERSGTLAERRDELAAAVDAGRRERFEGDAAGRRTIERLAALEDAAAGTPVRGPGIEVTVSDPAGRPNLSDAGQRSVDGRTVVLDRDLQVVVDALWESGAEAVAVGGVRLGPGATIRRAGGAVLVDNQPVFSPYTVAAIGPQGRLQTGFLVSDAYLRMSSVAQLYGIGFTVDENDDIALPAAAPRETRSAYVPR
ncbi:DUF881 domain-containing protein [Rhodococcus rhodnii]|uniref:DUF881 domain-containing protein n=2 Tax=Rhodococcus rhodnii TaxID=38312 RepID=R7WT36_9NOCA|nr:DUF881 domain-containing protein [Rhodococcus rhodnii]EOM78437.1 hypothetical protein Rrhod_0268 [Rhodococcus rhodnii LMG 5362]TXG92729.1 DUF881 domain-containing protein [Rhodococcus rhodnii]